MRIFSAVVSVFLLSLQNIFSTINTNANANGVCYNDTTTNSCTTFTVSSGTGCAWMCNYCANELQTNNYYFTDNVCSYQAGVGCVGNPIAGNSYTCCTL